MMQFELAIMQSLSVHKVGNKGEGEGVNLSQEPLDIEDENIRALLLKYFLSPFKGAEYYQFSHTSDLNLNETYTYVTRMFEEPEAFHQATINLANHLYEQQEHPNIKPGELYVAYLQNCRLDGELTDAIGIFKSESRETYLKVYPAGSNYEINAEDGINIHKLDKGCLIFQTEKEEGYRVAIVDATNRSEAQYWRDDFLQLKLREDSYQHTRNVLSMCKSFVTEKMPQDFDSIKADEIDLMNRSFKFFKEKENFDMDEFSQEVMHQPELIDAFKDYKNQYQAQHEIHIADSFDISEAAVKKQAKVYKSILKLDKNFHIYIHGDRSLIERGYDDEKGMHYYKAYFKEEK